jgi:hypothetical protein
MRIDLPMAAVGGAVRVAVCTCAGLGWAAGWGALTRWGSGYGMVPGSSFDLLHTVVS